MSRTWMIRSAEITSSSVAWNAATSCVGRSEMKPTVSDRIALSMPGQRDLPHRRVERREQQVLRHDVGAGQAVEQRRLAGIGIADQRDHRPRRALAPVAVQAARAADLLELACAAAPCGRGSGGGRPRSGFRPGRRGSRSRRAGARGGSSCAPAGPPDNRDARVRPATAPRRSPRARRRSRGSARCGRSPWRSSAVSRLRCWIGVSAASTTTSSASAIAHRRRRAARPARCRTASPAWAARTRNATLLDDLDADRQRRARRSPPAARRRRARRRP